MNFSRSFKLVITLMFFCFSSVLGMEFQLPTIDSIHAIKFELAKYLARVETVKSEDSDVRLVHEGISTNIGVQSLLNMFSNPVAFPELKNRQEILKELVELESQDFDNLNVSFKKLATLFKEFSVHGHQIEQIEAGLNKLEDRPWTPDLDMRMALNSLIALPILYSTWSSSSWEYFSAYVGVSMLFSALDKYFLNGAISARSWYGYIFSVIIGQLCKGKGKLLAAGNSVFTMDEQHFTNLLVPNACAQTDLLTCAEEKCHCVGPDQSMDFIPGGQASAWNFSGYIPKFLKSTASFFSKANGALLSGNFLLSVTPLNKYIVYKKAQSILTSKKKKRTELLNQFIVLLNDLNGSIKKKDLKLSRIEIDEQVAVDIKYFATLDVFFGLASLMRASNQRENGAIRFRFGFVDFVEADQDKNRFEISIKNLCHFLKFKPEDEYKTAAVFAKNYIFPELVFVVSENNEFFVNGDEKAYDQINFLTNLINPIYAQMLLSHTFGIVWGESAKIKFIDMNKLAFISGPDKEVRRIIFPE